jgi:hypothetical protein
MSKSKYPENDEVRETEEENFITNINEKEKEIFRNTNFNKKNSNLYLNNINYNNINNGNSNTINIGDEIKEDNYFDNYRLNNMTQKFKIFKDYMEKPKFNIVFKPKQSKSNLNFNNFFRNINVNGNGNLNINLNKNGNMNVSYNDIKKLKNTDVKKDFTIKNKI